MGRFILTNQPAWNEKLRAMFLDALSQSGSYDDKDVYFTIYHKINVNNDNFFQMGDDFVACCGTLFYKDKICSESLEELYLDIMEKDITDIRRNMNGAYTVVYKIKDKIGVITDEPGTYSVYYYNKDGKYLLTNCFYHVASCVDVDIDRLSLLEDLVEFCVIDNGTPFSSVYRLMGNQSIVIDSNTNEFSVKDIELNHYKLNGDSLESVAEEIAAAIKKYMKIIKTLDLDPILFTTGGTDSRLLLSAYMNGGFMPIIANWQGSPYDMNTKSEDCLIAKALARMFGLKYQEFDINIDLRENFNQNKILDFNLYGEYATVYSNNPKWYDIFRKYNYKFYDFGILGEIMKEWDDINNVIDWPISLDDFVDIYIKRIGFKTTDDNLWKRYKIFIKNKFRRLLNEYSLDCEKLSREACMILYCRNKLHANTLRVNFVNLYGYSLNVYGLQEIIELVQQVPYEYKKDYKLQLSLMKYLASNVFDIPFFSHCMYRKFDSKNTCLYNKNYLNVKCKKMLGSVIRSMPYGNCLLNKYKNKKRRDSMKKLYLDILGREKFEEKIGISVDENSTGYLPWYARTVMYSRMFDYIQLNRRS